MRIRLHLTHVSGVNSLPLDNYPLASLIYRTVELASPGQSAFLHEHGYTDEQTRKKYKFFVFSRPYVPGAYIRAGRLWFAPGRIEWQISSPIDSFIQAFIIGLQAQERIAIGDSQGIANFVPERIEEVPLPRLTSPMRFTALSPITVAVDELGTDGQYHKHYVRADDSRFGLVVASNLLNKYRVLTGNKTNDLHLRFDFDRDYIKLRGGVERVSKLIQYKGVLVKSYMAPFIVEGSEDLIRLGWECGFGASNSQGFGMAQEARIVG
ncbi:MAG: hypothetical protein HONDAALG_00452 [Gammaproteobacteria bacterium]|nr:hypothetical protein [Gammaproteobacteria bacterium]